MTTAWPASAAASTSGRSSSTDRPREYEPSGSGAADATVAMISRVGTTVSSVIAS
jgi:hypothetical protein